MLQAGGRRCEFQGLPVVHQHVPGGGTHKDLHTAIVCGIQAPELLQVVIGASCSINYVRIV